MVTIERTKRSSIYGFFSVVCCHPQPFAKSNPFERLPTKTHDLEIDLLVCCSVFGDVSQAGNQTTMPVPVIEERRILTDAHGKESRRLRFRSYE